MLIAIDVPFLRGPVARMIAWGERRLSAMFALLEVLRARLRPRRKRGVKFRS